MRKSLGAFTILFSMMFISGVCSAEFKAGSLVIENPWTRTTPAGAKIGGGYVSIRNNGSEADRLVGGSLSVAGHVEIHEMKMEGDVMRMRALPNGLEIPPAASVQLKPGGYHVMFMDLKGPFKQGETVSGELRFEKVGAVKVEFKVEPVGATGSTASDRQPESPNETQISDLLHKVFDKPGASLSVSPVVVAGDHAIADWAQGDMGGRALLQKKHQAWLLILCAGDAIKTKDALTRAGVPDADAARLERDLAIAEFKLDPKDAAMFSRFEGPVVMDANVSHNHAR